MHLALAEGERSEVANSAQFFGVQIFWLRREQGRLAELEAGVKESVGRYPALRIWRCGLAFPHCELGRPGAARRELDAFASRSFADLPRDTNWTAAVALLAEICARLEDAERAAVLYDLLLPHATRNVAVATGAMAILANVGMLVQPTSYTQAVATNSELRTVKQRRRRPPSAAWNANARNHQRGRQPYRELSHSAPHTR